MSMVIGSDGLSLYVENTSLSGAFDALAGMTVTRFEVQQRLVDSNAVSDDAWVNGAAISARRLMLEAEALATDSVAAEQLRSIALSGELWVFRLALTTAQMLECTAFVTQYREVIQPGEIKKLQIRLESSGAVTVV